MQTTRTRTRPTQRERSDGTIEALLQAARDLFADRGYHATSLDAVCDAAHVTKGALYHHFSSKQHLFRAVYEREQARLSRIVARAYRDAEADSWEAVFAGARAFLAEVLASDVQRINLLDAPGALGMDTMREISSDCLLMMQEGIRRAAAAATSPRTRCPRSATCCTARCARPRWPPRAPRTSRRPSTRA